MKAAFPSLLVLSLAAATGVESCTTDNPPAYSGILGPTRETTEVPSTGGSAGSGGGPTGGVATGGSGPSTGGISGTGGAGGQGEGGEGATGGTGGGKGGTGGSAGTTVNPPEDPNFSPACFRGPTAAGEEILKGTPCTAEDPKVCYRPCGPNQSGWKTETCTASVYAEGDCTFPADKDYSCYKIPAVIDEGACGLTAAPAATDECSAPPCMTCNFGGFYQDSGANSKEGYCTCREADADGVRRWSCASTTAWPCPFNRGC